MNDEEKIERLRNEHLLLVQRIYDVCKRIDYTILFKDTEIVKKELKQYFKKVDHHNSEMLHNAYSNALSEFTSQENFSSEKFSNFLENIIYLYESKFREIGGAVLEELRKNDTKKITEFFIDNDKMEVYFGDIKGNKNKAE